MGETEAFALGAAELTGCLPGDAHCTAPGCEQSQHRAKQLSEDGRLSSHDTEPLKFKLFVALIASLLGNRCGQLVSHIVPI